MLMAARKSDPMTVRRDNRRLVLRALFRGDAHTRAELARWTGLTRPATSSVVADLIGEGLVVEMGQRAGGAQGKRPTLIEIPGDARSVVGIQLEVGRIVGALGNVRGQIAQLQSESIDSLEVDQVVAAIAQVTRRLLTQDHTPALGIGLAMPGLIDTENGIVKNAVNMGWRDVPLRQMLRERFDLPVYVANDTDCVGLAELLFGVGNGHRNICTVFAGTGVGSAFIRDGTPYAGANWGAGEIGHLVVDTPPRFGFGGRRALLEEVVGLPGIQGRLRFAAAEHEDPEVMAALARGIDLEMLKCLADSGRHPAASQVVEDTGSYLGRGLAVLVNVLNPSLIVLCGPVLLLGERLTASIWEQVRSDVLPDFLMGLEIVRSSPCDAAPLVGAVGLVLRRELGLM